MVTVFSVNPPRGYITNRIDRIGSGVDTRVEAGSNTSTVTLRVVGDDEKGSLKSETVKSGHESQGTRTRERLRWRGPAAYTNANPSSLQRGRPTKRRPLLSKSNKYLVMSPRWGSTARLTGWLTLSRNVTLIFDFLNRQSKVIENRWKEGIRLCKEDFMRAAVTMRLV
jgi:hypothetical protein